MLLLDGFDVRAVGARIGVGVDLKAGGPRLGGGASLTPHAGVPIFEVGGNFESVITLWGDAVLEIGAVKGFWGDLARDVDTGRDDQGYSRGYHD